MHSSLITYIANIDQIVHKYIQNHLLITMGNENLWENWLNFLLLCITYLGNPSSIIYLSIAIMLLLWILKRPFAVICFATAIAISGAAIFVIKEILQRVRPEGLIGEAGYSFPSGHALIAAVFFPLCIYLFKKYVRKGWARNLFVISMAALALLIGFTRIYFGVHYISDVFGGFIIGGLISAVTILIMEAERRKGL